MLAHICNEIKIAKMMDSGEYEINKLDDNFNIHYSYEYNDVEVEGTMNLTIENNKFTFEDKKNSLFYTIYQ